MSCQKSHPYKLKKGTIKDMKNEKLALIFRNFWLVDSYIRGVLLKETIIFLHSRKSGKSYEQSEEDCEKSEINLSEELRRIRSKKTWSWFYLHVFLFRPLVWGGGGILFYLCSSHFLYFLTTFCFLKTQLPYLLGCWYLVTNFI